MPQTFARPLRALLLAAAAVLAAAAAVAQPAPGREGGTPALMRALAQGGYVIYFRHGHTQWQQKIIEQAMQAEGRHELGNCATQRNLDALGRADAARIHAAIRAAGIPVGAVLASLYCRPAEYVQLITGKSAERVRWLTGLSTPESLRQIKRAVATAPAAGINTFLGGHGERPFDLTGLVIQEGDALVFDPRQHRADDQGKFKPVAWIKPAEWAALAAAAPAAAAAAPASTSTTAAAVVAAASAAAAPANAIASITWPSSVHHSADNVRASLPMLREGLLLDPARAAALARGLALVRENPTKNLEVAYAPRDAPRDPTPAAPGGVQATVALADVKPWRLDAGIDHASTHAKPGAPGHDRLWLAATHANLWQADHQATLRASQAARSGHDNWSLAYRAPVPAIDTMLGAVATGADDGAGLDAAGRPIAAAGRLVTLFARRHLTPAADYHHHVQLSISDNDWTARNGAPAVRSRPLALGYTAHWQEEWIGWDFGIEGRTNLPGGSGNDAASHAQATGGAATNAQGAARWSALRAEAQWLRVLTYDIRLRLSGRAQWADRALIPGEQLALGGALAPWGSAFGVWTREPWLHRVGLRGLPERAVAGDGGALASAELWSRRLCGQDLRIGGFVDAGTVRRHDVPAGGEPNAGATSAGVVAHWQLRGRLAASLSAARLVDGAAGYGSGTRRIDLTLVGSY
ncbi:MAG: hypothetical protein JNJ89_13025 [Rubrivivax sp.]|nr:hypothetical protein [Rubrivivax sp.]